ncbi:MAG: OmpA family protein [Solirubrobacterales bacterium]
MLITAGSLVGFVAFAGAVIVWTRFQAINVPPDQAVKAMPREELVATGSSLLLIFGFFGVLTVLAAYLVDRSGRATPGMVRWLLAVLAVEGVTAVILTEHLSPGRTVVIATMFLFPVFLTFLLTFVPILTRFEDELAARESETLAPKIPLLQQRHNRQWIKRDQLRPMGAALACGAVSAGLLVGLEPALTDFVAYLAFGLALAALILALVGLVPVIRRLWRIWKEQMEARESARAAKARPRVEVLPVHRPQRFYFRSLGIALSWGLMLVAVVLPALVLWQFWLAISLGVAVALTGSLWRIAVLPKPGFMWFGLAVFLSVPLFGTLTLMARNLAHPQVQPMALIRSSDGPDEAIQGLYVTEGDDRIYFAEVATEGCRNEVTPTSGRLLWVPKSEVVAMSLGPLESVEQASRSALEMSYALTPAVETPAGTEVSLTSAEKQSGKRVGEAVPSENDHRLENAGPAVQPNFGAGLSLSPEEAAPGEIVTLTMSSPNGGGFGRFRSGKTLRLGGVRADVVKVGARSAERAEYVETESGHLLRLEKDEPYVERGSEYVPLSKARGGPRQPQYLKLADRSVVSVREGEKKLSPYLKLEEGTTAPLLDGDPEVVLRESADEPGTKLDHQPLSQAWYRNRIQFVVPENAATGTVSVECRQLAGQPLLRVDHAPKARIVVRMVPGSGRVTLDSSHSSDEDSKDLTRRWTVGGLRRGHSTTMSADLPPRLHPYAVTLAVTDQSGEEDTTTVRLLRLPAWFFALDRAAPEDGPEIEDAAGVLRQLAKRATPAAIEVVGNADDTGGSHHNMVLSMRRAENVRDALLPGGSTATAAESSAVEVPVTTLAYGEGCPLDSRGGMRPRNRRVDVFVLDPGVRVVSPAGCHPGRFESTRRYLPAPSVDGSGSGAAGAAASSEH